MTLKLGRLTTIVISSPQEAKQILQENGQVFSSRTVPHSVHALDHHMYSVVWLPPSPKWRNFRRVCAAKVFSPQMLDSSQILRQQKVHDLLNFVKERCNKGEVVDIGECVFTTILNSISTTFFSMDLSNSTEPEKSHEFMNIIRGMMEEMGRPNVADFFPILRPLDPQRVLARTTYYFKRLLNIIDEIIEERMSSRSVSKSDSKDALDSLLNNIDESGSSQLSRNEMSHLFLDLLVAGIDTTSSTVEWIMAELLRNPDKLAKTRKELSEAIGKDASLEESHILKLPFLRAVVKETLRLHPPGPFLVPHKCDEMVTICGFNVPKNSQILVNVWAMGRDPSIWENPEMFMPERFLECEIDSKSRNFEFIPFGSGKRMCPGLLLAQRSMHLMVASLVHNFEWKLADGLVPEDMNMNDQYGITLKMAQPLLVQAVSIQHN